LSVGACIRMGHLMGLNTVLRKPMPKERSERSLLETKRCLWWGLVVVERYVC
jgi:hypothetical protein